MTRHHSDVGAFSAANPSAAEEELPVSVLVVDDNADHLEVESIILRAAGYEVRTAQNVAEARTVIDEYHPAVIVLDVGLPEEDGLSFGRSLRSDQRNDDIAIVIYTAYGDRVDRRRLRASGADAFLTKPARAQEYLDTVRDCLDARRPAAAP